MASRDHYNKYFDGEIDIYRVCRLYNIQDPAIYHAIKKLLRFGDTDKSPKEDVEGAILALERWLTMEHEDENKNLTTSEEHMREDLGEHFSDFVDRKADEYEEELVEMAKNDDLSEEEKRDLLYDLLVAMENHEEFIADNMRREIWDLNYLTNRTPERMIDELLNKISEMKAPLNYRLSKAIEDIDGTGIQKLTARVHDLDKGEVQSLVNEAKKADDLPAYPFFTGLERRKTKEWLRFMEMDGRKKVKAILDEIESQE